MKILKKIPLDIIKFSTFSVRRKNTTNNLDDLKFSIQAIGLINPIIVCPNSDNTFDLLDGQKRKMVYDTLNRINPSAGFDMIDCLVVDEYVAINTKKVISFSTEVYNQPIPVDILKENIHEMWDKYASFDIILKKCGISKKTVKKYVKYARLPLSIQNRINDKQITIGTSIKVVDALNWDYSDSEENLFEIITELEKLKSDSRIYNKALKILKQSPNTPIETIIQESIISTKFTTMKITLPNKLLRSIRDESIMNVLSTNDYVVKCILENLKITGADYDLESIMDDIKKIDSKIKYLK